MCDPPVYHLGGIQQPQKSNLAAVGPFRKRCYSKYIYNLTRRLQRDVTYYYTSYKHPLKCSNRQQKRLFKMSDDEFMMDVRTFLQVLSRTS